MVGWKAVMKRMVKLGRALRRKERWLSKANVDFLEKWRNFGAHFAAKEAVETALLQVHAPALN